MLAARQGCRRPWRGVIVSKAASVGGLIIFRPSTKTSEASHQETPCRGTPSIGLDMANLAADRRVDRIILVMGDRDCVRAVKNCRIRTLRSWQRCQVIRWYPNCSGIPILNAASSGLTVLNFPPRASPTEQTVPNFSATLPSSGILHHTLPGLEQRRLPYCKRATLCLWVS